MRFFVTVSLALCLLSGIDAKACNKGGNHENHGGCEGHGPPGHHGPPGRAGSFGISTEQFGGRPG